MAAPAAKRRSATYIEFFAETRAGHGKLRSPVMPWRPWSSGLSVSRGAERQVRELIRAHASDCRMRKRIASAGGSVGRSRCASPVGKYV